MSFQGLFIVSETVRIIEELMEIWPNEVCDKIIPKIFNGIEVWGLCWSYKDLKS